MKTNRKFALAWFVIGLSLIKFVGWDGLAEQRAVSEWPRTEASIISNTVTQAKDSNDYNLGIRFRVAMDDRVFSYTCIRTSGSKDAMNVQADTTYASGALIPLAVNPENPSEFHFPKRVLVPWIAGFVPGIFFLFLGWSVLRSLKKLTSEDRYS
jgi:hypothetical protein